MTGIIVNVEILFGLSMEFICL